MDLRHVVDHVLLNDTKVLVEREREIMSKVLHHLREVDHRKLYADLGYSSMFAYCTEELKYSPDQAWRRISACRMLTTLPEIEAKLDRGELNLTVLGMAKSYFKENDLSLIEQRQVLDEIANKSKRDVEKILAADSIPAPAHASERKVSRTQTKVSLVLDDAVVEKLKELQALLSHTKKRELPELIDFLCTQELEKRKKYFATIKSSASAQAKKRPTRAIPAAIKKALWVRAQARCQHPGCHSRHFLQIHHRIPYSQGGSHALENLRLLCHAHHARGHFS
ncbi:MAG: HNH endonuclease [Bdellovibrio sp.]|nr:HNH endonuclease [Bdellovibrio sp.]